MDGKCLESKWIQWKVYDENSGIRYVLEEDIEYAKNLHD